MDLVILELVCWGGLLFFFWALKDGLGKVETDIESLGFFKNPRSAPLSSRRAQFSRPEAVREPMGSYRGETIYRFAVIEGRAYQFDRVLPPGTVEQLADEERYLAPGLVYLEHDTNIPPAIQT